MDSLFRVEATNLLDKKMKKAVASKMKNVIEQVKLVEKAAGIGYPPFYVEPVLTVVESNDNLGGLGVLYARTIPIEANGSVSILVELSAPLVLYGTKSLLKVILAHELLHYVELVKSFSRMDISSQITSSSVFEEQYQDGSRAVDPSKVYTEKRLISQLKKRHSGGFADEKLNEKCKTKWIEKGLPVKKIPMGANQATVSVEAIVRTKFDPKLKELISKLV